MMDDIEETMFQANVPGKYSTWKEEQDDLRHEPTDTTEDNDEDGDNDVLDVDYDLPEGSGENVDLGMRLQQSSLPDNIKMSILQERMQKHNTGVKGMLADHKAIQQLEKQERIQKENDRNAALFRAAHGHIVKKPAEENTNEDIDALLDEEEDDDFLASYRAARLAQLKSSISLPTYGHVQEITTHDELLDILEHTDKRVYVVIHLYETSVTSCVRMNKFLEELAVRKPNVLFVRMYASQNGIEVDISTLPVLTVYRAGECVEGVAGISAQYGQYFTIADVEHILDNIIEK
ncbi:hypothetical protein EON65_36395 [archaeon]|nr:MAG: hypothetical protein EON65_36395 [archaeon]